MICEGQSPVSEPGGQLVSQALISFYLFDSCPIYSSDKSAGHVTCFALTLT